MKNTLFLATCLSFMACKNDVKTADTTAKNKCSTLENGQFEATTDDIEGHNVRGNSGRAVNMNDYDSIYRYRGHGGWGEFDYICSIYRELDTPQYKVQLLAQIAQHDSMYDVSTKDLNVDEWFNFQKKIDEAKFRCADALPMPDMGCIDCSTYYFTAKENERKKIVRWRQSDDNLGILKGLGMNMLELSNFPMPKTVINCLKVKDSIRIEMYAKDFYGDIIKKSSFKHHFKGGKLENDVYQFTIPIRDSAKIKDIEMTVEFYNGKIRTTTEKQIRRKNF